MIDLYLSGALPALGAEVSRLPAELTAPARERPGSVIAELGISPGWRVPLPRLAAAERPSAIVTAPSTPPLLRDAAAASGRPARGELGDMRSTRERLPRTWAPRIRSPRWPCELTP